MNEQQLRKLHQKLFRFIVSERLMRVQVFPEGHPKRAAKLADCDEAMAALTEIKDFAKSYALPTPQQAPLLPVATARNGADRY